MALVPSAYPRLNGDNRTSFSPTACTHMQSALIYLPEALRALTTIAGQEPVTRSALIKSGDLTSSPAAERHARGSPP